MDNKLFKVKARNHQINFKKKTLGIKSDRSPVRTIRWVGKDGISHEKTVSVESSLLPEDLRDSNGAYVIFYPGFKDEITREIDRVAGRSTGQMVSNLLRSEHIPWNIFFPLRKDLDGATKLFNALLETQRIQTVDDIKIEYNPGGLDDGTSFDVYVSYLTREGRHGGIGIEVKYTEKEYPIKRGSKEWNETHNACGIHLADNYLSPSIESGWFKEEYIRDVPFSDFNACFEHVAANRYRQIWRNHILGASMVLGKCNSPSDRLDEFTSITVYPAGNGHFDDKLWSDYRNKLTDEGKSTIANVTFERLFKIMGESLNSSAIPQFDNWIKYLNNRYIVVE